MAAAASHELRLMPALSGMALGLLAALGPVAAADLDEKAALAYSQAAIGRTVGDYTLLDTQRRPVRLADYRGKPLIVSMIYTGCTQVCPLIVQTLAATLSTAQQSLDRDSFNAVTVGFDATADTPERLRAYARSQGADLPNWHFLAGDAATIDRLAADLGFIFVPSPKGFDHLAQTTVLDRDGIVYRQVYGSNFPAPALVEPLKELLYGRRSDFTTLGGLVNRVRLLCTLYNPATGRYEFSYANFVGMAIGALSLVAFGALVLRLWQQDRRRRRSV